MKQARLAHARVFDDEVDAARYAERHRKMGESLGRECARKLLASGLRSGRILDAGCGSGAAAVTLARSLPNCRVVGIDLSQPLLRLARQAAETAGVAQRACFEPGDVERLPYPDGSFDAALLLNMVHIVEHPLQMLNEIERVLVPGGRLFVVDLRRSWLGLLEPEIKAALTPREARELFARSELRPGRLAAGLLWWRFEV